MKGENAEVVSGKYLIDLFSSDSFIQTNVKAAKRVERTGHEHAFVVFKPLGKDRASLSRIFEGDSCSTDGLSNFLEKNHGERVFSDKSYSVVSVHFHPDLGLVPSPNDLFLAHTEVGISRARYGFDLKPINAIGRVNGKVDLLLYQQKVPYIPYELGRQLMEELLDYDFNNEFHETSAEYPSQIADKMNKSGLYQACIMKIGKTGEYDFRREEIDNFSFGTR